MKKDRSIYFVLTGFIILSIALYLFKGNNNSKTIAFASDSIKLADSIKIADSITLADSLGAIAMQNHKEKSSDVTIIEAKEFIQNRITTRNGFIVDYFTNNSYGHKLYNFLVSYGGEYCLMIVSDISLEILSAKCGSQVIDQFEEIKMLSK